MSHFSPEPPVTAKEREFLNLQKAYGAKFPRKRLGPVKPKNPGPSPAALAQAAELLGKLSVAEYVRQCRVVNADHERGYAREGRTARYDASPSRSETVTFEPFAKIFDL